MASYTCISCRVAFADGEVQRAHYKTDWHRYNLKRKVAAMPPVTAHDFQERVLAQRAAAAAPDPPAASAGCSACGKRFSSANAFRDHLQSQRHRRAEREVQRALLVLDQKSQEKGLGHERPDHDARNQALQRARGGRGGQQRPRPPRPRGPAPPPRLLWLEEQARRRQGEEPEDEEWEDVEEEEEVMEEEEDEEEEEVMEQEGGGEGGGAPLPGAIPVTDCLFCPHHSKSLIRSLAHMTRAHSFFIPDIEFLVDLRGLIRYLGEKVGAGNVCLWCNERGRSFYSTEAVQSHMTDKSHCRLQTDGDAALEFADFYDFRSSYPEAPGGGEETPDLQVLEYDDATLELTLPSGARIGHRSLMTYYRQRFGAQRQVAPAHRDAVLRTYRALGWGGAGVGPAPQQQRDMRYVQRMKARWLLRTGMNNNSIRQKHFRAQVMF